jgi:hypothetical protein
MSIVNEWLGEAGAKLVEATGDAPEVYELDAETVELLLDLARIAAHTSGDRRNAPLVSYLVGLAHGRRGDLSVDDLVRAVRGAPG